MRAVDSVRILREQNINAELLCYPGSKINEEADILGISTIKLKAKGYFNPGAVIKLQRELKKKEFDIIHTHASKDLWVLVPALNFNKSTVPLLLTKRVGSFIVKKDFFHKKLYNRVDYALAISRVIEKNLLETTTIEHSKIKLMYNGIDTEKYSFNSGERERIRNEFNIGSSLLVGMVGRFSRGKGHEEFLNSAKDILAEFQDVKFIVIGGASYGEDEYENKIKKLSRDLGIRENVIFTGFRKDIPALLSALDIFVFPSHSEAFGNALVEAMACERPSVCTESDGVLDICVNGETGYFFEKQNHNDLTIKLKKLITSPEKRNEFGMKARSRTLEMFDKEKNMQKLIDFYGTIITKEN